MNINLDEYIGLDEGYYTIGINRDVIENIDDSLFDIRVKREYLLNS